MDKNKIIEGAAKLVAKGAYDKAVKEYQKVLDADPKDARVLQKMGELFQKKNDNAQAAHYFTRVAESYSHDGFFLKAVALYKQVLKLNPNLLDVNVKLAELHQQLGLMSEAMAFYQVIANAHDKAGDTKSSLATLKKMVDLDPDNVASRRKLAELYAREGMNREAGAEFKRAADYYKRNNRHDDYLQVAERISVIEPDNLVLARELAQSYLQRGDQKRALGKLQICFKADSRDVETLQLLAQAFDGLGQTAKTISVYKELAKVYQDRGRTEELNGVWAKIAALDPHDSDLQARKAAAAPAAAPRAREPAAAAPAPSPAPRAQAQPAPAPAPAAPLAAPQSAIPRDQLAKLLTETDVYVKYGLHDKALEHLRRIFAVDPENIEAHEKAYQIYLAANHHAQAADQLLNVLRLCTRRADVQRAQPYLATILQQNPDHPEVPAFLAVLDARAAGEGDGEAIPEDAILVDSNDEEVIVADAPDEIIPSIGDDLGLLTAVSSDSDDVLDDEPLGDEPLSPESMNDEPLVIDEPLSPEGEYEEELVEVSPLVEEEGEEHELIVADDQELIVSDDFAFEDPSSSDAALEYAAEASSEELVVEEPGLEDELDATSEHSLAAMDLGPGDDAGHALGDEEEVPTRASPVIQSSHGSQSEGAAYAQSAYSGSSSGSDDELSFADTSGPVDEEISFGDTSGALVDDEVSFGDTSGALVDDEVSFADTNAPADDEVSFADTNAPADDEVSLADTSGAVDDELSFADTSSQPYEAAATDEQSYGQNDDAYAAHSEPDGAYAQSEYDASASEASASEASAENEEADEECSEAEFFIDQGVYDEARDILENVLVAYSDYPRAVALLARLEEAERGGSADVEEAPAAEIAPVSPPQVSRLEGEQDAFDLAAQLADEFGTLEEEAPAPSAASDDDFQYSVEEVFAEFKKGLEKVVKPEDVETHYDLGIAYKEMGLIDDAIGEFNVARQGCLGKRKELDCLTMVGLLQGQKGDFVAAVTSFTEALANPHASGETGNAVRYELGAAYEAVGQNGKALFHYQQVSAVDPSYRDVTQKVSALEAITSPEDDASASASVSPAAAHAGGARSSAEPANKARKVGYL